MSSQSLFRALAAAGLSLAVTACGPQDELSSNELAETSSVTSHLVGPLLSPDEARAAAEAEASSYGGVTHEVLGITYVRPHGVRPALLAYEVPVTADDRDGLPVDEIFYVDANDGSVLLTLPRDQAATSDAIGIE